MVFGRLLERLELLLALLLVLVQLPLDVADADLELVDLPVRHAAVHDILFLLRRLAWKQLRRIIEGWVAKRTVWFKVAWKE